MKYFLKHIGSPRYIEEFEPLKFTLDLSEAYTFNTEFEAFMTKQYLQSSNEVNQKLLSQTYSHQLVIVKGE
jgi:hypothetical protein